MSYTRIAATVLPTCGIHTILISGEYTTSIIRCGKIMTLAHANTEREALAAHKAWVNFFTDAPSTEGI